MNFKDFLTSLIPTELEVQAGVATVGVGTIIEYFIGSYSMLFELLAVMMVLDYCTGVSAAYIDPAKKLSSHAGFVGIVKKLVILMLIVLAHEIDKAVGTANTWRDICLLFFVGNEGLSILENASNCGVPIPEAIKSQLEQFTKMKAGKK